MQLFVTDKVFVHVIPMKKRSKVPLALKLFAKEVGAPDAIICDAAREHISQSVRFFAIKLEPYSASWRKEPLGKIMPNYTSDC